MPGFEQVELAYQRRNREAFLTAEARRWNTHSEYEVHELWCPFGRNLYADADGSGAAINRRHGHRAESVSACIGSRCAAWRWADTHGEPLDRDGQLYPNHGFCGLAGRP